MIKVGTIDKYTIYIGWVDGSAGFYVHSEELDDDLLFEDEVIGTFVISYRMAVPNRPVFHIQRSSFYHTEPRKREFAKILPKLKELAKNTSQAEFVTMLRQKEFITMLRQKDFDHDIAAFRDQLQSLIEFAEFMMVQAEGLPAKAFDAEITSMLKEIDTKLGNKKG